MYFSWEKFEMARNLAGQAVVEGVMIKNKDKVAVAVQSTPTKISSVVFRSKIKDTKLPFLRGVVNLVLQLYLGTKALSLSAGLVESGGDTKKVEEEHSLTLILTMGLSFVIAILLFKFLPLFLTQQVTKVFVLGNIWFSVIDGLLKLSIFVGYLLLIARSNDVQRLFQYHGAEHMSVHCYEAEKSLTVKNVQKYSPVHPRCGTTFLFLVFLVSIFVYAFIPSTLSFTWKLVLRILLLPVIASLSYELLRFGAKYYWMKLFIYPGLLLQKITTQQPTEQQIKVAIMAVKKAT